MKWLSAYFAWPHYEVQFGHSDAHWSHNRIKPLESDQSNHFWLLQKDFSLIQILRSENNDQTEIKMSKILGFFSGTWSRGRWYNLAHLIARLRHYVHFWNHSNRIFTGFEGRFYQIICRILRFWFCSSMEYGVNKIVITINLHIE